MVKPELDVTIDYYSLLSVTVRADPEEIKKAYRKLALLYHPDRNIGREASMVEKFQLLQTAHEVLSDPSKRATYDRTRGATGRATAAYTRTSTPQTPKSRRPTTGANGFSRTTPNTTKNTKPAFGHFTTREPPSAKKPPPTAFNTKPPPPRPTARKSPEKERTEAYFDRFREKTTSRPSTSPPKSSPVKPQFQRKEAQRAAGVKTPERKKPTQTRFGTTFEDETSEEETFYSFNSNGTFGGTSNGTTWSDRRGAYSHVFTGVKEDLRSPLKTNAKPSPTGFTSDGFRETQFKSDGFGGKQNGTANGTATKGFTASGVGAQNGDGSGKKERLFGGFAKQQDQNKSNAPPIFTTGPARRKSGQRSTSEQSNPPATEPKEIPKTPPTVEERLFASAFSRLNVNPESPKSSPVKNPKPKETVNIDDWTKKFEGMNPFMTPVTKKLSEDKNFWSSVPLKSTPTPARTRPARGRKVGGLENMEDMKRDLPKVRTAMFCGAGVVPVVPTFNVEIPKHAEPRFGRTVPTMSTPSVPPVVPAMNVPLAQSPPRPTLPTQVPATPSSTQVPSSQPQPPPQSPPRVPQQPTPASTPQFHPPPNLQPTSPPPPPPIFTTNPPPPQTSSIPHLNFPIPPKLLIPRPSNPKEFSFSVPPHAEMLLLATQVQEYHVAYIAERSRFQAAWETFESNIALTDENIVREYLGIKAKLGKRWGEMESLHTLCLERWGAVAKFSGFTG